MNATKSDFARSKSKSNLFLTCLFLFLAWSGIIYWAINLYL